MTAEPSLPAGSDDYVVVSDLVVPAGGGPVLEEAFAHRLGEVEQAPGFRRLEVWRSARAEGSYRMVTWWRSEADYVAYLRSDRHHRSHARIPGDPHRPRGVGVERFDVVAR